jgi:hypothetical protein
MATESEMKEAAAFAFNVDASQVTISDAKQQDVKTNFVATIGKTSHRCYVTKAAEPKLYGLIPLGGGSTVSDAICAGATRRQRAKPATPCRKSGPLLSLCAEKAANCTSLFLPLYRGRLVQRPHLLIRIEPFRSEVSQASGS